jgi:hypothetical protein
MTQIILIKMSEVLSSDANKKRAFLISNLNNFNWDVNTPVTPMPLPEDSHESNILVKMEGNSAAISVSWTMTEGSYFGYYDTSTDVFTPDTNTDGSDEVLTSYRQITKFKDEFIPKFIQDGFRLNIVDETTSPNSVLLKDNGTMNTIKFDISGQSPVVWNVSLQFMVGDVVSLFEADVPERPRNVYMSALTNNLVKIEWEKFNQYATTADAVPITGVAIQYKYKGNIWSDFSVSDLITSEQAVGLGSGATGSSAYTPTGDFRTFDVTNNNIGLGEYRFRVALLSEKSDAANIRLFKDGVKHGTDSTKTLTVT